MTAFENKAISYSSESLLDEIQNDLTYGIYVPYRKNEDVLNFRLYDSFEVRASIY